MTERIEWTLIKDLRVDDVVKLNFGATSHYYAIDTKPEPTGVILRNSFRGDMPQVEFWQTPQDHDLNPTGDSTYETANGLAGVQVLMPRPKA